MGENWNQTLGEGPSLVLEKVVVDWKVAVEMLVADYRTSSKAVSKSILPHLTFESYSIIHRYFQGPFPQCRQLRCGSIF